MFCVVFDEFSGLYGEKGKFGALARAGYSSFGQLYWSLVTFGLRKFA